MGMLMATGQPADQRGAALVSMHYFPTTPAWSLMPFKMKVLLPSQMVPTLEMFLPIYALLQQS